LKAARLEEPREHYERLKKTFGSQVSLDDVYDACVLAITAKARLAGEALHLTDGARDSRGLLMEIWG
jgi:predicted RNase H-like nuclease